jgi:hypothetical protein
MLGGWILFIRQLLGGPRHGVLVQVNSRAISRVGASSVAVGVVGVESSAVGLVRVTSKAGI